MLTVCLSVYIVEEQATVHICAWCMRTMPPVAVGGRSLVACQHVGRDLPGYNEGCELTAGEWGTGGGGGGEASGVVSRDKAKQMEQTMRHRHPSCMTTTPPSLQQTLAAPLSLSMCQSFSTFRLLWEFVCFAPFPILGWLKSHRIFSFFSQELFVHTPQTN